MYGDNMNINQDNINSLFNKYILYVDEISSKFNYESNIKHLLYVIVPAFIIKYGVNNEQTVLKVFRETKIIIDSRLNEKVPATFNRNLVYYDSKYYTNKFIMIDTFTNSSLPTIIDNIVHECNHAVNSINNEIIEEDKLIKIRTGLCTLNYNKSDLKFIEKSSTNTLEEILNTAQTEEIIKIIKSFDNYSIDNEEVKNALYAINKEVSEDYTSDAYTYQKNLCIDLVNNKTFAPTINNLRLKGYIQDIPNLFDNVIGKEGSYKELNKVLTEIHELIIKYSYSKLFKNMLLNKLREKARYVSHIIEEYERKCIFK